MTTSEPCAQPGSFSFSSRDPVSRVSAQRKKQGTSPRKAQGSAGGHHVAWTELQRHEPWRTQKSPLILAAEKERPAKKIINVDGMIDRSRPEISFIGDAEEQNNGMFRCLANVAGCLCIVEVAISLADADDDS